MLTGIKRTLTFIVFAVEKNMRMHWYIMLRLVAEEYVHFRPNFTMQRRSYVSVVSWGWYLFSEGIVRVLSIYILIIFTSNAIWTICESLMYEPVKGNDILSRETSTVQCRCENHFWDYSQTSIADDSFTLANWNSFFEYLRNCSDSSRKQICKEIFLLYHDRGIM